MTTTVALPTIIDDGRLDWALALLSQSRTTEKKTPFRLDWRSVTDVSPAGEAILCCLFDSFVEQRNRVQCIHVPKRFHTTPVVTHLMHRSNFSHLPAPNIQNHETEHAILRGSTTVDLLFTERFQEKFSTDLEPDLVYDCLLILNELMQNTVDHSTAERYYLYAGLWREEFHAGVLDMGSTVPAKMEQKYACASDLEYLQLALKEGYGTRRQRPGGIGLSYFFGYLKKHAGKLTLMSRGAQIRRYFNTRRSQQNALKYPLMGTWCFARFRLKGER